MLFRPSSILSKSADLTQAYRRQGSPIGIRRLVPLSSHDQMDPQSSRHARFHLSRAGSSDSLGGRDTARMIRADSHSKLINNSVSRGDESKKSEAYVSIELLENIKTNLLK